MITLKTSRTELRAPDMCPNCLKNLTDDDTAYITLASRHTETKKAVHRNAKHEEESTTETTDQAEVVLNAKFCNQCHEDYHYSEPIEYLPFAVMGITIGVYLLAAWLLSMHDADMIARTFDFVRGLFYGLPILIGGVVLTVLAGFYANSHMNPERKSARQLAQSALHLRKISMAMAQIDIREPIYAREFRRVNDL